MAQVGMMNIKRHSNDPKKFFRCSIPFCVFSGASELNCIQFFPPVFVICSSVLYSSSAEILLAKLDSYYLCGWHRWLMKDNKKKNTLLVPLGPFSFRRRDGACSHNWKKIWKLVIASSLSKKPLDILLYGLFGAAMAVPRGSQWELLTLETCKETQFAFN